MALVVMMLLLADGGKANASYVYDFQFGSITVNNIINYPINYPAAEFSFTSPALIGPSISDWPFIESLTLASPLDLNGYSFSTIRCSGVSYIGGASLDHISGLSFTSTLTPDFSLPPGAIGDFWVNITFPPGTYGPGSYASNHFGRGIRVEGGFTEYYTSGSLTITPAPATILLVGPGLVGLWFFRRAKGKFF